MTRTDSKLNNLKYEILSGNDPVRIIDEAPWEIFHKDVINFLSELSKRLLNKKKQINFTNYAGFGFWARKANLIHLKNIRSDLYLRVGRGLSLHIAPSNISANALYTFAFGLLSGSPSIIRLSKKNIDELSEILEMINFIFKKDCFVELSKKFSFITYEHETNLNNYFSSLTASRVIWGGDETIKIFKSLNTNPDCIDMVFPNKLSSSIISSGWLINAIKSDVKNQAELFARDIGLFSQMACSSPNSLILLKDNNLPYKEALLNFLEDCDSALDKKVWLSDNHSLSNFKSSVDICMELSSSKCIYKGRNLSVFFIEKNNSINSEDLKLKDSCLFLYEVNSLSEVSSLLAKNNQTIVCIGLKKNMKDKLTKKVILKGTNRLVNAGNALNMNIYWDGYDVIGFLSKIITFS